MVKEQSILDKVRDERIEGVEAGEVPEWFTSNGYHMFKQKYVYDGQTVKSTFERIAKTAAKHAPNPMVAYEKFFELLWKGWLAPSTPVLANMGTNRGCPVSCSGGFVGDSIYDFYDSQLETAMLTKNGFGTSSYLGSIRPRGTKISAGGTASGIKPVLKDFVQLSRDVSQGNQRRGAWAGYIPIDHGDFYEIADHMAANPDDLNVGWNISRNFIERLNSGDVDAIQRWQKALKVKCLTGKGYFFKVDHTNEQSPAMYKEHGLKVYASNLCFTGDTMVAVADGRNAVSIEQLAKESNGEIKFPVYSGRSSAHTSRNIVSEIKNAVAFKTGTKKVIKVNLSDGSSFRCTEDHRLATPELSYVEAKDSVGLELATLYTTKKDVYKVESNLKVVSIDYDQGEEDVYDLTVEDNHNFYIITNKQDDNYLECSGVLVHNCTEIALHSSKDFSFSCVLSSMNASKFDEWKNTDAVFWATVFLDCVASDFIEIGSKIRGLDRVVRFTERGRALGLGLLGYHTYIQNKGIPFEESDDINDEIFSHLDKESLRASKWLAIELGEPYWCRGYGVRNTHRIAIAPNTSSALICGSVSQGIEPVVEVVYNQKVASGEIVRVNPVFLEIAKERGKWNKTLSDDIIKNNGSVQQLDWLSEHEKNVFKTAFEIDQYAILRLASNRQKYIDQAQSINLFFDANASESHISQVHKAAMIDENIKSLYYMRSKAGVKAAEESECLSCEG